MSQVNLPNTIASGDADNPTRDMANWTTIRDIINGNLDNTNLSASAAIAISKLATFFKRQDDTTNTTPIPYIQAGWGQIQGNDAAQMIETITFPTAFTTAPVIICTMDAGYKTSAYTSITDGSAASESATIIPSANWDSITTANFIIYLNHSANNFVSTRYYRYTWIAIGV